VLADLCDWLRTHGVPADELPHGLFGVRPSALWEAVAGPGRVTLYLGEYQQADSDGQQMLWISRRDAHVAAEIVQKLSLPPDGGGSRRGPTVRTEYVPFRTDVLGGGGAAARTGRGLKEFERDRTQSRKAFARMRSDADAPRTSVLIGSQRVNYLLEHHVASLFGCEPFTPADGTEPRVPFYLSYREKDRAVPSCFGGATNPPGYKGSFEPGVLYLDAKGNWQRCPWAPGEEDAGILILSRDPGTQALEMALFGFSGRGTEALGWHLVHSGDDFWPPYVEFKGKQVGVYVCRFKIGTGGAAAGDAADAPEKPDKAERAERANARSSSAGPVHPRESQVVKMDAKILKKFLA
jgi:hypothetical protein